MLKKSIFANMTLGRGVALALLIVLTVLVAVATLPESIFRVLGSLVGALVFLGLLFCLAYYFIAPVREFIRYEIYKRRNK